MKLDEYKKAFIEKHGKSDWHVDTSPMDEYDSYHKTYIFDDGAQLTQVMRPVFRKALAHVEEVDIYVDVTVKLLEIECWNTDDATSYKWYEPY